MRRLVFLLLAVCVYNGVIFGQFNTNLDAKKGTSRNTSSRDDIIWHPEAANVCYQNAGNISLATASRYGLTSRWELSTFIGFDPFQPNLMGKFLWNDKNHKTWYFASKLNIGTAYPGMKIAQRNNWTDFVSNDAKIPVVGEVGHEFIASRVFATDPNCSNGSIYLILTGSLGTYWGINFKDGNVDQIPKHFLANRGMVLIDNDFLASIKLWADWKTNSWLVLHGGTRLHNWSFKKNIAWEIQAEAELFITGSFSCRLGGALSIANYKTTKHPVGGIPIIDITYYFGKRKSGERSLFNPNGKLY